MNKLIPKNITGASLLKLIPKGKTIENLYKVASKRKKFNVIDKLLSENQSLVKRTVDSKGVIRLQLPTHFKKTPREFRIEPQGGNKFYVHMSTWDGKKVPAKLTKGEKKALFNAVAEEIPIGGEILLPKSSPEYLATRGTIAGLKRLERDPRFIKGTSGLILYKDGEEVKTYDGSSFIKLPKLSNKGEYVYNERTGEFEYKMSKEEWDKQFELLQQLAKDYYASLDYLDRFASIDDWVHTAAERRSKLNHVNYQITSLGTNKYGDADVAPMLIAQNPKVRIGTELLTSETLPHTVFHEVGGHVSGGGARTPVEINNMIGKVAEDEWIGYDELSERNPFIVKARQDVLPFLPKLKPEYQALLDGSSTHIPEEFRKSGNIEKDLKEAKEFIEYMIDPEEQIARGLGTNIARYNQYLDSDNWNLLLLKTFFTPESIETFLKYVKGLTIPLTIGTVYGISLNKQGGKFKKWFK